MDLRRNRVIITERKMLTITYIYNIPSNFYPTALSNEKAEQIHAERGIHTGRKKRCVLQLAPQQT